MNSYIKLRNREIIPLPPTPGDYTYPRNLGIALDNAEAYEFIGRGYSVHGNSMGPFLTVRFYDNYRIPIMYDGDKVDIEFYAQKWSMGSFSGTTCWVRKIEVNNG